MFRNRLYFILVDHNICDVLILKLDSVFHWHWLLMIGIQHVTWNPGFTFRGSWMELLFLLTIYSDHILSKFQTNNGFMTESHLLKIKFTFHRTPSRVILTGPLFLWPLLLNRRPFESHKNTPVLTENNRYFGTPTEVSPLFWVVCPSLWPIWCSIWTSYLSSARERCFRKIDEICKEV